MRGRKLCRFWSALNLFLNPILVCYFALNYTKYSTFPKIIIVLAQLPLRYQAPRQSSRYNDEVTGWTVRDSNAGVNKKFCFTPKFPYRIWGSTSLLFHGYGWSFPEVERPGCEYDHLPPSSTEVKNKWSYTSSPTICFHNLDRYSIAYATFYCDSMIVGELC